MRLITVTICGNSKNDDYFATCEGDDGKIGHVTGESYEDVQKKVDFKITELFGKIYQDVDVRHVFS